jgi:hypothetical protein
METAYRRLYLELGHQANRVLKNAPLAMKVADLASRHPGAMVKVLLGSQPAIEELAQIATKLPEPLPPMQPATAYAVAREALTLLQSNGSLLAQLKRMRNQ